jgi:hypothetical protein
MAERAVTERLEELAGFSIVPGTLNVRLPRPLERSPSWRYVPAAEIRPDWEARTGQAGYFLAAVTVAGRYRGLAFQAVEPGEPGYPPDQIELSAKPTCVGSSVSATATRLRSGWMTVDRDRLPRVIPQPRRLRRDDLGLDAS